MVNGNGKMKTVEYPEFLGFLSSFPFETQGVFVEEDMSIRYFNKEGDGLIARCTVSDNEEPFLHHGIYCKDFQILDLQSHENSVD